MNQVMIKLQNSTLKNLYDSFSPASQAAILFAVPFTLVDAIHYYTAGSALIFSIPLLVLIYLLCGALAAKFACQDEQELSKLPGVGRSAGVRLWLTSTLINTLLAVIVGLTSLGITLLGGAVYLCLFAPLHALGSALIGWIGGWIYQQYIKRTGAS
jgi:hypothetical protein